jgi:repressor of nif and glnA expression
MESNKGALIQEKNQLRKQFKLIRDKIHKEIFTSNFKYQEIISKFVTNISKIPIFLDLDRIKKITSSKRNNEIVKVNENKFFLNF